MAKNNKTRFFYVLYSDKTRVFDQSELAYYSIYIINIYIISNESAIMQSVGYLSCDPHGRTDLQHDDEEAKLLRGSSHNKKNGHCIVLYLVYLSIQVYGINKRSYRKH